MEYDDNLILKRKYETRITYTSIIMKTILIVMVLIGFILSYFIGDLKGYSCLLYFTLQSNIWIAIFDMIMIGFLIHSLINKKYKISNKLYKIQQVFSVCICITCIIYCFILIPGYFMDPSNAPEGYWPFTFGSILLHMLVPIIAIVDYFLCVRWAKFYYWESLYVLIPTVAYLILTIFGYVYNWDYGNNLNYPYFFLNYGSPAGIFGFSNEMPYFMGSFYWIIIILILTLGLSILFIKIINIIDKKALRKISSNMKG